MAKPVNRRRVPGKRTNKTAIKKREKMRKKTERRKARQDKQVGDLADRLANATSMSSAFAPTSAAGPGPGARQRGKSKDDEDMEVSMLAQAEQPKLSRAELKKKLRAKVAGHQLDRTQGLDKGQTDSRGLKKRQPRSKGKMDMS
mmetsp:Transcript_35650/g.89694  ORF Transcript_35650/g.89694 Transcript_35650/m.89694 type:complete len:144 (-) Transcript_35650:22-453(-)